MPPLWFERTCYVVSIHQLVAWRRLQRKHETLAVGHQDPQSGGLRVTVDGIEKTITLSGQLDPAGASSSSGR
jgi:hypothetical protein